MEYTNCKASEIHETTRWEPARCVHSAQEMAKWAIAEAKRKGTQEENDAEWLFNRLADIPKENLPVRQPDFDPWLEESDAWINSGRGE